MYMFKLDWNWHTYAPQFQPRALNQVLGEADTEWNRAEEQEELLHAGYTKFQSCPSDRSSFFQTAATS